MHFVRWKRSLVGNFIYLIFFYDFYPLVKRIGLHIIFWLVYLLQDIMLQYTWNMNDLSLDNQFWRAVGTAFMSLPAKLLIVYYFIYRDHSEIWEISKPIQVVVHYRSYNCFYRRLVSYFVYWAFISLRPYMYNNHSSQ